MIAWTKLIIYGILIGIANIIPGLSGGTTAVILNVYDSLIAAVANIASAKSIRFLFPLLIGAGTGILFFSKIIEFTLENYNMITNFFFIGIIIGSLPMLYKKAFKDKSKKSGSIISFAFGVVIMILMVVLNPAESENIYTSLSLFIFIKLFVISAISASAMIIPGISGSFLMLLFGTYTTVLTAISDFNIIILIPVALGILFGLFLGAKLISILLKNFCVQTYGIICGLVVGSVFAIYPGFSFTINGFISILFMIIGAISTFWFSSDKRKRISIKGGKK